MIYKRLWLAFLNLFYPHRCLSCKRDLPFHEERHLCPPCLSSVAPMKEPLCRICGLHLKDGGMLCFNCKKERPSFNIARSASPYEGALQEMVRHFKYGGKGYLATELADFLYEAWKRYPELWPAELILPVPLHAGKRRERGYNQAELLAQGLKDRMDKAGSNSPLVCPRVLKRGKNTGSQTGLPREKRIANVSGAFEVLFPGPVKSRKVLLVDDVCTTGATLNECARVLRESGAKEVNALVLARD